MATKEPCPLPRGWTKTTRSSVLHAISLAFTVQNLQPRIEILAHGLRADEALQIESAAIDLLGVDNLANAVRGWHQGKPGRMPVRQLIAHYQRKPVTIREPAILIRINRLFHYGMTETELYDATRSA